MKIFLAAIGSGGDLLPVLGVGLEFKRRGHDVTVLAGAWQEESVNQVGLTFRSVLSHEDFHRFTARAKAINAPGGAWVAFFYDAVMPAISTVYAHVAEHQVPGDTLLIGSSHALGLRFAAEKHGLPLVTTRLQPQAISADETSDDQLDTFNKLFTPLLNRSRQRLELAPITRPFDQWLVSLEHAVAFFPSWFPDLRVDAAEQGRMVDFVFYDPVTEVHSSLVMDAFLAGCDLPIVFTHGTGNDSIEDFFKVAMQACAQLGKRAIILTRHGNRLPAPLPPQVLHLDYFPLDRLLPYVDAIVYHGGIGTCAQALRAGTPQLVVPIGFDQYQNAERVQCLGAGFHLSRRDFTIEKLKPRLMELLGSEHIRSRCRELAQHFMVEDPIPRCCDVIEELARN
jgi:rhamnosyltransferase subunit B